MPDDLDPRLTAALAERYALERELGQGGMATVYLARDLRHERQVALKVMRPEIGAGLGAERFLREIRIAAQLSHPHILPLFDSGEAAGLLFYVMPYVEGESLRHRLEREKQLPLEEALRIGAEVAGALAYAHSRGVVHRDIKPENILLEGGHARVADFGIARALHAAAGKTLTETGLAVGTPAYMSPEQAAGERDIDARSDVYSLGCVLYEVLGGEVPYLGTTPQSIFAKKMSGPPPLLSALRETVSPELERVVEKALARSPADRWSGAQPLADALLEAATAEHAEGTPVRASRRAIARPRWWTKRALAAGAALAVIVAGVFAVRAWRTPALESGRVLIAPFENATGDPALAQLGWQAADQITQGLVQAAIPGVAATEAPRNPAGGGAAALSEADLRSLARAGHAGLVLSGSYYRQGDTLRFQVRIGDAATGSVVAALEPITGSTRNIPRVVGELRQRVMSALAIHADPDAASWGAEMSRPPLYDTYLMYRAAFAQPPGTAGSFDWTLALGQFHRAYTQDSTFTPALLWEGMAEWCASGGVGSPRLDSILAQLERLREPLSRNGQWRLDWLKAMDAHDMRAAYEAGRLLTAASGSTADRMQLASDALKVNRPREAARLLQGLDPSNLDQKGLGYGTYGGNLARSLHILGDFEGELRAFRQGLAAGESGYALEYAALRPLAALGRYAELQQALDDAVARAPDPSFVAWYYSVAGVELMHHGSRDSGVALLRRGIALVRGWQSRTRDLTDAERREEIAVLQYAAGDWEGCGGTWGDLRRVGNLLEEPCPAWVLAARRGDRAEANRLLARNDSTLRGARPQPRAYGMMAHARVAALLGDRETAMTYLRQAMQMLGFDLELVDLHSDPDFDGLRDDPPFIELLRPKG